MAGCPTRAIRPPPEFPCEGTPMLSTTLGCDPAPELGPAMITRPPARCDARIASPSQITSVVRRWPGPLVPGWPVRRGSRRHVRCSRPAPLRQTAGEDSAVVSAGPFGDLRGGGYAAFPVETL